MKIREEIIEEGVTIALRIEVENEVERRMLAKFVARPLALSPCEDGAFALMEALEEEISDE